LNLTMKCGVQITGQVIQSNGTPVRSSIIVTTPGSTRMVTTNEDGRFVMSVPPLQKLLITAMSTDGKKSDEIEITTPPNGTRDLGQIMIGSLQQEAGTVSFKLNGAGFDNKVVNINTPFNPLISEGFYMPGEDITTLIKANTEFSVIIAFEGKKTGRTLDANFTIGVAGNKALVASDVDENLVLHITKYGAVNGTIEGTFSGQFEYIDLQSGAILGTVIITDGIFSLHRSEDQ